LTSWGFRYEALADLGVIDEESALERDLVQAVGENIARLCRIGECLARASRPDVYPDARDAWEAAKIEIESRLGPDGLTLIRQRFSENCEEYLDLLPEAFRPGLVLDENYYPSA